MDLDDKVINSKNNCEIQNVENIISSTKTDLKILYHSMSIQQEKYDNIKNFCLRKNDQDNFPLIPYENYLLIDGLFESNTAKFTQYKNFLLSRTVSIEIFSKFCILLMNRFIVSSQNSTRYRYP